METMIVTGAGSGIGLGLTLKLLAENYRVSAWDVAPGDLAGVNDDNLAFHQLDVRDADALAEAAAEAAGSGDRIASFQPARRYTEPHRFLKSLRTTGTIT